MRRVLSALDRTEASSVAAVQQDFAAPALRRFSPGADLRMLLNDTFNYRWCDVSPRVRDAVRLTDRARICADAAPMDALAQPRMAASCAWLQLAPGAGLQVVNAQWPDADEPLRLYFDEALEHGAAIACLPHRLATAIVHESASRPRAHTFLDEVGSLIDAWRAASFFRDGSVIPTADQLAEWFLRVRAGVALRAEAARVRQPRVLALAELLVAVALIRLCSRLDLLRSYREAGGDALGGVARLLERDQREDLMFEVGLQVVLRPRQPESVTLIDEERDALAFVAGTIASDERLLTNGVFAQVSGRPTTPSSGQ